MDRFTLCPFLIGFTLCPFLIGFTFCPILIGSGYGSCPPYFIHLREVEKWTLSTIFHFVLYESHLLQEQWYKHRENTFRVRSPKGGPPKFSSQFHQRIQIVIAIPELITPNHLVICSAKHNL